MKLIYCPECDDILAIHQGRRRYCRCKASSGKYRPDGWHADVYGKAILLGFSNHQLCHLSGAANAQKPSYPPSHINGQYPYFAYSEFKLFVQPPWHPQAHYHED